jgi:hypothetical protein
LAVDHLAVLHDRHADAAAAFGIDQLMAWGIVSGYSPPGEYDQIDPDPRDCTLVHPDDERRGDFLKPVTNMEWHTDLKSFLLDNLNFIQEQIEQAQNDPSDRRAAVDAARGVVPLLRERLCGLDDPLQTSFSLAAGQWWEGNNWTDSWNRLIRRMSSMFRQET